MKSQTVPFLVPATLFSWLYLILPACLLLRETWSSPTKQADKAKGVVEREGRTRHPGSNLGGNLHGGGGLTLLSTAKTHVVVSINDVKFRVPITDDTLTRERARMKRVFFGLACE